MKHICTAVKRQCTIYTCVASKASKGHDRPKDAMQERKLQDCRRGARCKHKEAAERTQPQRPTGRGRHQTANPGRPPPPGRNTRTHTKPTHHKKATPKHRTPTRGRGDRPSPQLARSPLT